MPNNRPWEIADLERDYPEFATQNLANTNEF